MAKTISVLLLVLLSLSARAALINLQNGETSELETRLAEAGRPFYILVEKDCAACKNYYRELATCSLELRQNLRFISVSSPLQTKSFISQLPDGAAVYLMSTEEARKYGRGTPTTMRRDRTGMIQKKLGALTCEGLNAWRNQDT